jgi:hypothetical protein
LQLQLSQLLPDARIFMDLDSIEGGLDFAEAIEEAVASCAVLVALIGRQWATLTYEDGARRLDNPDDSVRFEVKTALERGVRVIPVLLDGARPLRQQELPVDLQKLALLTALKLSYDRYQSDADRLVNLIQRVLAAAGELAEAERKTGDEADRVSGEPAAAMQESRTNEETGERIKRDAVGAPQFSQPKIFLCYRREDTQGFARGIYESLAGKYGHEQVFRDIDSTPVGVKFSAWIESRVGQCNVMVVLIGHSWLSAKDSTGQRRLDLPKDWVRQEIEAALRRDIPIIPVRVQAAPMPSESDLPPSIADFTGFQSAEVTDSRWDYDVGLLIQAIDTFMRPVEEKTSLGPDRPLTSSENTLAQQWWAALSERIGPEIRRMAETAAQMGNFGAWRDLAQRLGISDQTARAWHRNAGRSIKRVNSELGTDFQLFGWNVALNKFAMADDVRAAILGAI